MTINYKESYSRILHQNRKVERVIETVESHFIEYSFSRHKRVYTATAN